MKKIIRWAAPAVLAALILILAQISVFADLTPVESVAADKDKVIRGKTVTWNIVTDDTVASVRLKGKYTTQDGTAKTLTYIYKTDSSNITVSSENGKLVWTIDMTLTYSAEDEKITETWTLSYKISGSTAWENYDGFEKTITVGRTADSLIDREPDPVYEPYSLIYTFCETDILKKDAWAEIYVRTTDDCTKVRISAGGRNATYMATSTNTTCEDMNDGTLMWTIRYKFTQSGNMEYAVSVRGTQWSEPLTFCVNAVSAVPVSRDGLYTVVWHFEYIDGNTFTTTVTDVEEGTPIYETISPDSDIPSVFFDGTQGYEAIISYDGNSENEADGSDPVTQDSELFFRFVPIDYSATFTYTKPDGTVVSDTVENLHVGDAIPSRTVAEEGLYEVEWTYPDSVKGGRMPASDITVTGTYYVISDYSTVLETAYRNVYENAPYSTGTLRNPGAQMSSSAFLQQTGISIPDGYEISPDDSVITLTEGGNATVHLSRKNIPVTLDLNYEGCPESTVYIRWGSAMPESNPERTNYVISGWYGTKQDADSSLNPIDFNDPYNPVIITAPVTFYAGWERTGGTISCQWDSLDGVAYSDYADNIPLGASIADNLPARIPGENSETGYRFLWYLDSGFSVPLSSSDVLTGDTVLYGRYEYIDYTLSWSCVRPGDTQATVVTQAKHMGEEITDIAPENYAGYGFIWDSHAPVMPASDMTINGTYTYGQHTVIWTINGEELARTLVDEGSSIEIPELASTPTGRRLSPLTSLPDEMPAANLTVECEYVYIDYTITWVYDRPDGVHRESTTTGMHYRDTIPAKPYDTVSNYVFEWNYPSSVTDNKMPAEDITVTGTYTRVGLLAKSSFGGTNYERITDSDSYNDTYYACGVTESVNGDFSASGSVAPYGFIARYDSDGNLDSLIQVTDSSRSVSLNGIATLRDGGCVVCGSLMNTTSGNTTAFLAVYSPSGSRTFYKDMGGTGNDAFTAVAATSDGFVTGAKVSSKDSDFTGLTNRNINTVITRYASDGSIIWSSCFGSSMGGTVNDIDTDGYGNAFVTIRTMARDGDFSSFSGLTGTTFDNVAIKFNSEGNIVWHYVIAGNGNENLDSIVADGLGGCAVAGYFTTSGHMNTGTLSDVLPFGGTDSLVIKLSYSGAREWYRVIGGTGNDFAYGIAKCGSSYAVTGATNSDDCVFDSNYGEKDGFICMVSSTGKTGDIYYLDGSYNDIAYSITSCGNDLMVFGHSISTDAWFSGLNTNITDQIRESWGGNEYYDCFAAKYRIIT